MLDLSAEHLSVVKEILNDKVPNCPVWVFGSRIKGTAKRYSDLDLAIITKQPLTIRQLSELDMAFSESDLPFKVDVIDWASCSDNFKQCILQQYEILI